MILVILLFIIIIISISRTNTGNGTMDDTLYPFEYYNYVPDEQVDECYHYPINYNVYSFY